jgi:hypothetical protein
VSPCSTPSPVVSVRSGVSFGPCGVGAAVTGHVGWTTTVDTRVAEAAGVCREVADSCRLSDSSVHGGHGAGRSGSTRRGIAAVTEPFGEPPSDGSHAAVVPFVAQATTKARTMTGNMTTAMTQAGSLTANAAAYRRDCGARCRFRVREGKGPRQIRLLRVVGRLMPRRAATSTVLSARRGAGTLRESDGSLVMAAR